MTQKKKISLKEIDAYLKRHQQKELLRFVTVGSVDDGKSTLIGRLLHDTESVYLDQIESAKKSTKQNVGGEIDFSLFTDGLKAEREQGITIDVAYRYFTTEKRKFIIADTPGHVQYTRNMATGASTAHAAIILIDARLGVLAQSKRHAYIASLLGIPYLVVCINKMDLVGFKKEIFDQIKAEFTTFCGSLGFTDLTFIPISALNGDNVVSQSDNIPWYHGGTLLSHLETLPVPQDASKKSFAFPVQYVIRPNLNFRGFAGSVASGQVSKGDEVVVLPSGKKTFVKSIVTFGGEKKTATSGDSVTITLKDEVDISRGDFLVDRDHDVKMASHLKTMMVWLSEKPLEKNRPYWIKHATNLATTTVEEIGYLLDIESLEKKPASTLKLNDIANVSLKLSKPLVVDTYKNSRNLGAFILIDRITNATVACGMVESSGLENTFETGLTQTEKETRLRQKPVIVRLATPKTESLKVGQILERTLFESGHMVCLLQEKTSEEILKFLIENLGMIVISPLSFIPKKLGKLPTLDISLPGVKLKDDALKVEKILKEKKLIW